MCKWHVLELKSAHTSAVTFFKRRSSFLRASVLERRDSVGNSFKIYR